MGVATQLSAAAGVDAFLPRAERDTAARMVAALLRFDRVYNEGQIDLVLALPVAAEAGASLATVRLLLDAQADVDERDRGCSALWQAARHGHAGLVDLLAEVRGTDRAQHGAQQQCAASNALCPCTVRLSGAWATGA